MCYSNYDDYMRNCCYYNPMLQMDRMNVRQNFRGNSGYSSLYPSIYRIIQPVINRMVSNNKMQFINEDSLESMVDNVYNIVEGDVSTVTESEITNNLVKNNSNSSSASKVSENSQNKMVLLRDLIKILIIKELISRNSISGNEMGGVGEMYRGW